MGTQGKSGEARNQSGMQHLWGYDNWQLASVVPDASHQNRWQLTVLEGNGRAYGSTLSDQQVAGSLRPGDVRRILRALETGR
jgi:hypothetical protein